MLAGYSETSIPWFPKSRPASSDIDRIRVQSIDTVAGVDALLPDWQELEAHAPASATVFQSAAWCRAWIARYVERARIAKFLIVTLREGDQLKVIWPLCIYRSHGLNEGRWLGEPMSQYGDALTDETCSAGHLSRVWQAVLNAPTIDLLNLRKVRDDAAVRMLPAFGASAAVRSSQNVVADLGDFADYAAYAAKTKAKVRRERARKGRRLAEYGEIDFEILTRGSHAIAAIKDAIAFKESWLDQKGISSEASMMTDPFAILTDLAADGDGDCLVVSRLSVAGETAAIEVGFRWQGGYYAYLGAFNSKFEKAGAGAVQMEKTIAWCIDNNLAFYDLFAPADAYKLEWGDIGQSVSDFALASSLKGRLYVEGYLKRARPFMKKVHDRLPVAWRQRLIKAVST